MIDQNIKLRVLYALDIFLVIYIDIVDYELYGVTVILYTYIHDTLMIAYWHHLF